MTEPPCPATDPLRRCVRRFVVDRAEGCWLHTEDGGLILDFAPVRCAPRSVTDIPQSVPQSGLLHELVTVVSHAA